MKKKIFKIILFVVIFILVLIGLGRLLKPSRMQDVAIKSGHELHEGLYEQPPNSLDVLYLGSSHVFSSISPEDIYNDYGVTGYVLSQSCEKIWQSYFYLEEAFKTQSPSVVVLDVFTVYNTDAQTEEWNREAIDCMKLSKAKIDSIKKALEKNDGEAGFVSYIFPVFRYHDRWEMLEKTDLIGIQKSDASTTKGFIPRFSVDGAIFNGEDYSNMNQKKELNNESIFYLNQMYELCKENGAELVMVKYPTCLWSQLESNGIREYAKDKNIDYLDFNSDTELRNLVNIDWKTESLDSGNHINYSGAMKVSKYMGEWLTNKFSLKDKRGDSDYIQWQEDYNNYKRDVENYFISCKSEISDILDYKDGYIVFFVREGSIEIYINGQKKEERFFDQLPQKLQLNDNEKWELCLQSDQSISLTLNDNEVLNTYKGENMYMWDYILSEEVMKKQFVDGEIVK